MSERAFVILAVLAGSYFSGLAAHEILHTIPLRLGGYPFSYALLRDGPRVLPDAVRALIGGPAVRVEISVLRIPHRRLQIVAIAPMVLIPLGGAVVYLSESPMLTLAGMAVACTGVPSWADCRYLLGIGRREYAVARAGAHYHHRLAEGVSDPFVYTTELQPSKE